VEISASSATITSLSERRVVWLGCLDKSLNIFFESNVERIRDSSCLSSSVAGVQNAFEVCGSSHRVVEKINTHLVTEFILVSLEGLALTNGLGKIGNPRLVHTTVTRVNKLTRVCIS